MDHKFQMSYGLIFIIFIFGCNEYPIEQLGNSETEKREFSNFTHAAYHMNGKFYLSGCSRFFGKKEKEIMIGDHFYGFPDKHSNVVYQVEETNPDRILFSFRRENTFGGDTKILIGKFSIPCGKEQKVIPPLSIDGLELGEEAAKHFVKKPFLIVHFDRGNGDSGLLEKQDSCYLKTIDYMGFDIYHLYGCCPSVEHKNQIKSFNRIIFQTIEGDTITTNNRNAKTLIDEFGRELGDCRKLYAKGN